MLPHKAVALEQTLQEVPGVEVEAERIAAHSTEWTMPCLWATSTDFGVIDDALQEDPTVDEVVEMYEFDDEKYYQLEWSDAVIDRINSFTDQRASILEAEADSDGWRVQIRFASREQFDAFRETLDDRGHSFDLLDLAEPGAPRQTMGQLTPNQRDALVAAVEQGYYEIPREITANELAATLDISQQALSERLRRGVANFVHSMLTTDADTTEE